MIIQITTAKELAAYIIKEEDHYFWGDHTIHAYMEDGVAHYWENYGGDESDPYTDIEKFIEEGSFTLPFESHEVTAEELAQ